MVLDQLLGIGSQLINKLIPDPEAKAAAALELEKLAQSGELARMANETDIYKTEQVNTTTRWSADMASDSWLSKNIRPMMLIALFSAYIVFATASVWDLDTKTAYVELLGQWGMLAFSFYFGSRGMEKVADIWASRRK